MDIDQLPRIDMSLVEASQGQVRGCHLPHRASRKLPPVHDQQARVTEEIDGFSKIPARNTGEMGLGGTVDTLFVPQIHHDFPRRLQAQLQLAVKLPVARWVPLKGKASVSLWSAKSASAPRLSQDDIDTARDDDERADIGPHVRQIPPEQETKHCRP